MITTYVFDFSRVLLFPKNEDYQGELNTKYREIKNMSGFSFLDNFSVNEELLSYLRKLKDEKDLYIFTSGLIQNDPSLKPILESVFKKIFSAEGLGVDKKDPSSFTLIAKLVEKEPQNILFIDDTQANILAAEKAGLKTIQYIDNVTLIKAFQSF